MTRMMILLLAASLPMVAAAQNVRPMPNQTAPPDRLENDPDFQRLSPEKQAWVRWMNGRIEAAIEKKDLKALKQLELEFGQRKLLGTTFCGEHVVNDGTFVDDIARNNSREEAYAVRWLAAEPGVTVHTAIFTASGRCVARDGEVLDDGKALVQVMPNSLSLSNQHGFVAYEALYWPSPSQNAQGSAPRRAIFIENRYLADLDPRRASAPFSLNANESDGDVRWNDKQEVLDVKPGIALLPLEQGSRPPLGGRPPIQNSTPSFLPQVAPPAKPAPAPAPQVAAKRPTTPKQPPISSAQNGCGDSKAAPKAGAPIYGALRNALGKPQRTCPVPTASGQGAKQ
jgi:hypothetical protein